MSPRRDQEQLPSVGVPTMAGPWHQMQDRNSEPEALLPPPDTPGQAPGTGARGRQLETGPLSHQYSYHREETADPSVVTVAILQGPLGQDSTGSQGIRQPLRCPGRW